MRLYVRTSARDPLSVVAAIRAAVHDVDQAVPVAGIETMQAVVDRAMSRVSFSMVLLGIAGGVALILAGIGLYGVISYLVTRRRAEIGVRIALGADPRHVMRMVLRESMRLAAAGLGVGVVIALLATRLLQSLLFGVEPTSAIAYAAGAAALTAVALLATWLPARRAARIEPADLVR
jgi:ABC-type antimicrobial peptide transport system permease subunit